MSDEAFEERLVTRLRREERSNDDARTRLTCAQAADVIKAQAAELVVLRGRLQATEGVSKALTLSLAVNDGLRKRAAAATTGDADG